MSMKFKAVAAAVGIALSALTFNAIGCSTVIVGKDASKTGTIIIGHNEDNGGRILNPQYWVPPQDHADGEMIKFEPAAASIPQVKHTFGFTGPRPSTRTAPPSRTASSMRTAS